MLSSAAPPMLAQMQCSVCSCADYGARLQRVCLGRRASSSVHPLLRSCSATGATPRGRQPLQRRAARVSGSQKGCTSFISRHGTFICGSFAGSVPSNRALSRTSIISSRNSSSSSGSGSSCVSVPAHPPACRCQLRRCQADWSSPRRSVTARASLDATVQDALMGSSIAIAIGMALYYGSKGEPQVCEGCGGAGGVRCFACDGSGVMASTDDQANLSPAQQRKGSVGGALRPRAPRRGECRACRGSGLLVCKRCNGSGYSKRM